MNNLKIRKRVPKALATILNRREFNVTFNTSAELNSFNTALNEAIIICNSPLPDDLKASTVLNGGLKRYHIQPKIHTPNSLYLDDIFKLYLKDSKVNVTAREQRRRVLLLDTIPSMFSKLHIPIEINKITASHMYSLSLYMGELKGSVTNEKRQPQTVNREIKILRGISSYGTKTGLYNLPFTPTLKVPSKPIGRCSLPYTALTFVEPLISSNAFILLQTIYYSGMRNSEVSKFIVTEVEGVLCFDLTNCTDLKTESSKRLIPIHSKLIPHIDIIRSLSLTNIQTLSRHINKALEEGYTVYSARHSFITNLINNRVAPHIVGEVAGHTSNNSQTLTTYFHGTPINELKEHVELL